MLKKDQGNISKALIEVKRLITIDSFESSINIMFQELDTANEKESIYSPKLQDLLSTYNIDEYFLTERKEGKQHLRLLIQLLLIHSWIKDYKPAVDTLRALKEFLNDQKIHKDIFNFWEDGFLAIAYLEHLGNKVWQRYAATSTGDWDELSILDDSLPFSAVTLDSILNYLDIAIKKQVNDLALPSLGNNIIIKMSQDGTLRLGIEQDVNRILFHDTARRFLPSFIKGIIDKSSQKFLSYLKDYLQTYQQFCYDILWAFGTACPIDESCMAAYKESIDCKLNEEVISPTEYLNLSTTHKFDSEDVIQLAINLSNDITSLEQAQSLLNFLTTHIEDNNSYWFKTIASNIIQIEEERIIGYLNHFIYRLIDKNKELVYALFTLRFERLGNNFFLKNVWRKLAEDKDLFSKQLTIWFNLESPNVHSALFKLCSVNEISNTAFILSDAILSTLTSSEKLYIAMKITGYVYSKDHLQTLIMSLTKSIKANESKLLLNLYEIFSTYVIYNYRSTLDLIKKELENGNLPYHIVQLYTKLDKAYEVYFHNISLIKKHPELSHNSILLQHIQYYKQQLFSQGFKKSEERSFWGGVKETKLHSTKWAIRRPSEKIHIVSPLGHFSHSMEWPSGEVLNPILQESKRRIYQRITKNEVNID